MLIQRYSNILVSLVVAVCTLVLVACGQQATDAGPDVTVEDAWARPAAADTNSAIYFTLRNTGGAADRLVSVTAGIAEAVEMHETTMEGEVMKMQPVGDGVEVPAGGNVQFEPGGYHVMLIGLTQALQAGDTFPLTLTFEQSNPVDVTVEVRQP